MPRRERGCHAAMISLLAALLAVLCAWQCACVAAQIDVIPDPEAPVLLRSPEPTTTPEAPSVSPRTELPAALEEGPPSLSLSLSPAPNTKLAPTPFPSELATLSSMSSADGDGSQTVDSVVMPADVSIDQIEDHLDIVFKLEQSVARSIEEIGSDLDDDNAAKYSRQQSRERRRLRDELRSVQSNLRQLALGLNGTLLELQHVEQAEELQSQRLREVLAHQREEEEEQKLEETDQKAVDYETGHLKNTTGLSSEQLKKVEAVEKKADPAVLHYDMELLGQVAVLLGASAIGGIIATYFNIPPHAGYLLGGALVGPACLGVVRLYEEVETVSLFGSVFLLFGHGAAYSPQKPEDVFRKYCVGGVAYIVSTVVLVAVAAVSIGWTTSFVEGISIGVGVCFSTTAPLYEHIRANQIQDSSFGRTVTAIIAVQDLLMSFALGTPEWFSVRSYGWIGVAMVRSIVAYAAVLGMTVCLHQYVVPRLLRFLTAMEEVHHSPLVLLGVVSVCLSMALFTETIGLSLECGAFLAGLAFVHVAADAKAAFTSIRVMENFFGSMFFACVGMILHPMFLLRNAGEILSMVLLIVCVKTLSMTVVMTFFRISPRRALQAAVGLCQIGELALIFMIKAHASKLVSRRTYLLFVASIAVFLACSSVFNRKVVLARRKNVFRLPSIVRGRPGTQRRHSSDLRDLHGGEGMRSRAGSSSAYSDVEGEGGGGDEMYSSPVAARRQASKHHPI